MIIWFGSSSRNEDNKEWNRKGTVDSSIIGKILNIWIGKQRRFWGDFCFSKPTGHGFDYDIVLSSVIILIFY